MVVLVNDNRVVTLMRQDLESDVKSDPRSFFVRWQRCQQESSPDNLLIPLADPRDPRTGLKEKTRS